MSTSMMLRVADQLRSKDSPSGLFTCLQQVNTASV